MRMVVDLRQLCLTEVSLRIPTIGTLHGVVQQTSSSNTHTITNLDHGVTSVVVTDDNGCTKTSQVTVEQADELLFSVYRIKNESCSGQVSSCDGELL